MCDLEILKFKIQFNTYLSLFKSILKSLKRHHTIRFICKNLNCIVINKNQNIVSKYRKMKLKQCFRIIKFINFSTMKFSSL